MKKNFLCEKRSNLLTFSGLAASVAGRESFFFPVVARFSPAHDAVW